MKRFVNRLILFTCFTSFITACAIFAGGWLASYAPAGMVAGGVAGVALSAAAGYVAYLPVRSGMQQLLESTERAIEADLTYKIKKRNYGWGEFHQLVVNVSKVLKGINKWFSLIKNTSDTLDKAAGQITSGTEQVSSSSQEQADQVQQLLNSIESLDSSARESAEQGKQAAALAADTSSRARQGGEVVKELSASISAIDEKIASLASSAQQINNFLEVIQNIASQTNLLALNAAIEASRAGEHGRGFAVVAEQIRKLADESDRTTQEVANLTASISSSVEETVSSVKEGVNLAQSAGEEFQTILELVDKTKQMVENMARTAESQAETISSMVTYTESISAAAQEAAASSQETASVAQELTNTSEEIKKVADIWKLR